MIMVGIVDMRWGKVYFPHDRIRMISKKSDTVTRIGIETTTGAGVDYEVEGDLEEVALQIERAVHGLELCNIG